VQSPPKLRYYDASRERTAALPPSKIAPHSEFLRTGRISRAQPVWFPDERRYLSHEDVATRTGKKLEAAGEMTHERINRFHRTIQLPKIIFHRTIDGSPHLGYCHVTAASTFFQPNSAVRWSFYLANFVSDIGESEEFFLKISPQSARMYFAVAIDGDPGEAMQIDRRVRGNGLLFKTTDPKEAMKNVLMLGAPDRSIREIIKRL
jgi:hypothetical protein